jgi:hypothetical protein
MVIMNLHCAVRTSHWADSPHSSLLSVALRCGRSVHWFDHAFENIRGRAKQIEEDDIVAPLIEPGAWRKQGVLWADGPETAKRLLVHPDFAFIYSARVKKRTNPFYPDLHGFE